MKATKENANKNIGTTYDLKLSGLPDRVASYLPEFAEAFNTNGLQAKLSVKDENGTSMTINLAEKEK